MEQNSSLDILKQAMLLEQRSKVFYTRISQESKDEDVANFFQLMAREEQEHLELLTTQFKSFKSTDAFSSMEFSETEDSSTVEILSQVVLSKITAASFEAAAIQSAMDMEKRAVTVYSERALTATNEDERKFYKWLAKWEGSHMKYLAKIDSELREEIWEDNDFWPF